MGKTLLGICLILIFSKRADADFFDTTDSGNGVVVENKQNIFQPYIKRRKPWGILLSFQMENYSPENYTSVILKNTFDGITKGGTVPIYTAELGLKYNLSIGSVAGLVSYGAGTFADYKHYMNRFNVSVTKFSANFTLDALMNEPLVAPYIQGGMHRFQIYEESKTSENANTQFESPESTWTLDYRAGLLFQLNWIENSIDPESHAAGLRASGLENTYLDIFYASYAQPSSISEAEGQEGEPDTASTHFGVGLKIEF